MGLPCAHTCDIKKATGGLTPADFHKHWYWDRDSTFEPLRDPIFAGRQRNISSNPRVASTGRILSNGEERTRQPPRCSACHLLGHSMASRNCPLKLQLSTAIRSQELQNEEIVQVQSSIPTTTVSITASIPAFSYPTTTYTPTVSPIGSQISIDLQLSPVIASNNSITTNQLDPGPGLEANLGLDLEVDQGLDPELEPKPPKKQLSPNRPEVLMQAYLAEKNAWLTNHPNIRPIQYRKVRKLSTPRPKILKEYIHRMPKERRDLQGNIISQKANWTNEEIMVWLDNEERLEEEQFEKLQLEFIKNGNRHKENTRQEIWGRVIEETTRESEQYIL